MALMLKLDVYAWRGRPSTSASSVSVTMTMPPSNTVRARALPTSHFRREYLDASLQFPNPHSRTHAHTHTRTHARTHARTRTHAHVLVSRCCMRPMVVGILECHYVHRPWNRRASCSSCLYCSLLDIVLLIGSPFANCTLTIILRRLAH